MTNKLVQTEIKEITDNCTGIKVFFVDENNKVFDSDIENGTLDDYRKTFVENLKSNYVDNENFTSPKLSAADDRNHVLYQFDFRDDEKPFEFSLLDKVNNIPANESLPKYEVKVKGLNQLKGYIIRLKNLNGKVMSFYQYVHHSAMVTPKKGAFLTIHKTRVVKLDHDVLKLGHRFVVSKLGEKFFIGNVNALEKELAFDKVIHTRALSYCKNLKESELVENLEKFNKRLENETAFARKFVKIYKGSAVIEQGLPNDKVVEFAMSKDFYKNKLKLTENETQFDLNSIDRCNTFLKLLDDEFLKSELTNQDYIVKTKDRA